MGRLRLWLGGVAVVLGSMQGIVASGQIQAGGARVPEFKGISFTEHAVNLPEDLQGKVGVLVVGFSKGSRDAVTAWGKRLAVDYYDAPNVAYYEMPVLASVPKFIRGYVIGQIRASVSDRGKAHFVPVLDHEPEWRALAQYKNGDDAYVLVVDSAGGVRWQTHADFTEASYAAMKAQVEGLRSGIGQAK